MNTEVISYLLFLVVGFILGRMSGVKVVNNTNTPSPIKKPNLNPFDAYKNKKEKEEQERLEREARINLENVNNYDGTDRGQKDIE